MVGHSLAAFITSTCLLWSRHRASELDSGNNATFRSCRVDEDCGQVDVFVCRLQTHCACRNSTFIFFTPATCLPISRLGEECHHELQCRQYDAVCLQNLCTCPFGGVNQTHCSTRDQLPSGEHVNSGYKGFDPNMIPLVVVLPIMFVGMCVVLHLFSKARFRNRRTIFNSPHPRLMHIKLGRKKRRTSHASLQLQGSRRPSACSPHPSRPGSRMGSLHSLNAHGAPIAHLDSSPSCEALDKKNGVDVFREAVIQNGSPTAVVTQRVSTGSNLEGHSPTANAITRV